MVFTFAGKLKEAMNLEQLLCLQEKMAWWKMETHMSWFQDRAKKLVTGDVEELAIFARACEHSSVRCGVVEFFIWKYGVKKRDDIAPLLSVLLHEERQDPKTKDLVGRVMDAGKEFFVVPEKIDRKELGELVIWMNTISSNLQPFADKGGRHPVFEAFAKEMIDRMTKEIQGGYPADEFLEKLSSLPDYCQLMLAISMIKDVKFSLLVRLFSDERLLCETEAAVQKTRELFKESLIKALGDKGCEVTFLELYVIAGAIRDYEGNGTGSREIEILVIEASMHFIQDNSDALMMAYAFSVKTGRHRFFIRYLDECSQLTNAALRSFAESIGGKELLGDKAQMALLRAREKFNLSVDLESIFTKNADGNQVVPASLIDNIMQRIVGDAFGGKVPLGVTISGVSGAGSEMEAFTAIFFGGDSGSPFTDSFSRRSSDDCRCAVCQISAVKDPHARASLLEEFENMVERWLQKGILLKESGKMRFRDQDAQDSFFADTEVSEGLRVILDKWVDFRSKE